MKQTPTTSGAPPNTATLWAHLHDETCHVHAKWLIYRQLFGTSEETYNLLMDAARSAFTLIEQALLDDVQLTLAKLVDANDKAAGLIAMKEALRGLPSYADWVQTEFDPNLSALNARCKELIKRRNHWIAHHAKKTVDAAASKPRMNPARQEIEDALMALRLVMNATHRRFGETEYAYEHVFLSDDGETLVEVVRRGSAKLRGDGLPQIPPTGTSNH